MSKDQKNIGYPCGIVSARRRVELARFLATRPAWTGASGRHFLVTLLISSN